MMVEVPSNVLLLDEFIDCGIDGVSIGSNDLTQLTLGIDRDSERFADTFDERKIRPVLKANRERDYDRKAPGDHGLRLWTRPLGTS